MVPVFTARRNHGCWTREHNTRVGAIAGIIHRSQGAFGKNNIVQRATDTGSIYNVSPVGVVLRSRRRHQVRQNKANRRTAPRTNQKKGIQSTRVPTKNADTNATNLRFCTTTSSPRDVNDRLTTSLKHNKGEQEGGQRLITGNKSVKRPAVPRTPVDSLAAEIVRV
jgi:hypothetical protein